MDPDELPDDTAQPAVAFEPDDFVVGLTAAKAAPLIAKEIG